MGSDEEEEEEEITDSDCTVISNDVSIDIDEITVAHTGPNKRKSDEGMNRKKRLRIIEMSSDSE